MRFVIIYRNTEEVRKNIEKHIPGFIRQGIDFSCNPINLPFFSSRPFWPDINEIRSFPMNVQCEEVDWDGQKLNSIRRLVIDAEILTPLEKTTVDSSSEAK